MDTLYLDPLTWDFALDASGNLALANAPYALAQDAASAIRTFLGECYYDTTQGIPYFTQLLGERPSIPLMKAQFVAAAMTVPGIVSATVYISAITDRQVTGQVQVTDATGTVTAAGF